MSIVSTEIEAQIGCDALANASTSSNQSNVTQNPSVSNISVPQTAERILMIYPKSLMDQVYKYAEEAILRKIAIGSRTFKNFVTNRIKGNFSEGIVERAIDDGDYSQLKKRHMKNGKVVAKESLKYSLTQHAKERTSKPTLENVTPLFKKYLGQIDKGGIKSDKVVLEYLKDKIQPRDIPVEVLADIIDTGVEKKLPGQKAELKKGNMTVIVSKRDHSIITAYGNYTNTSRGAIAENKKLALNDLGVCSTACVNSHG